ncbi:LIM domain-containing protein 1 isoform X21 [Xyrauchen texanus]|uniref:LIM domain-containing protein 1 isoform X20 n=1 Tax=Xyrauchen texanus TaxID=154827 RepID=UPI002241AF1D|nr:LIM domain-containing protein 1 isoform X20 [Xyrauchen texanus]XP_051991354.1 LIM domain-containing protein 1 isoform X21 [Xyrauchen texanus]
MDTNALCFGTCVKCRGDIYRADQACQAMGELYHDRCFTCFTCSKKLCGKPFYYFSGRVYCEEDYLYSSVKHFAEVCTFCGYLITDMVLQALGKSFHPNCFRCVVCNEKLEGKPFSVDTQNKIYCVKDYQRFLAKPCAVCGQLILPTEGSNEIVRVVSTGRSYHVGCFDGKSNI